MTVDSSGAATSVSTPSSNLVSWWRADGNAADATGNNPGVPESVSFSPGRVGQAFGFASAGDVLVPDSPSLRPAALTVMAWVKHMGPPAVNTNAYRRYL